MNKSKDFLMIKDNLVYFDNAATTFKPLSVINKEMEYLTSYTANSGRGDYNIAFKVDDEIDNTRYLVSKFINASDKNEIVFTSGTTESLNLIVFGFFKHYLKEKDEVILNKAEHASNILPWLVLKKEIGIVIKYVPLDDNNALTIDGIKKVMSKKTKVIAFAEITNVIGDIRNVKEITNYAHKHGALVVVDAAQSAPHKKIDVKNSDVDFLAFSAHKMLGPTGVGIMYAKEKILNYMLPIKYGGGMNLDYNEKEIEFLPVPYRFEGGTQNISGIIAFSESIKYLENLGMENIERKEKYLRKYLINELKKIEDIKIYNENSSSSIVLININGETSSDLGLYLNTKNICVRTGKHCTKMLKDEAEFSDTVRISLYFYNTYEEIDYLVKSLKNYKKA